MRNYLFCIVLLLGGWQSAAQAEVFERTPANGLKVIVIVARIASASGVFAICQIYDDLDVDFGFETRHYSPASRPNNFYAGTK